MSEPSVTVGVTVWVVEEREAAGTKSNRVANMNAITTPAGGIVVRVDRTGPPPRPGYTRIAGRHMKANKRCDKRSLDKSPEWVRSVCGRAGGSNFANERTDKRDIAIFKHGQESHRAKNRSCTACSDL
jgi:hypothetical protein